MRTLLHRWGPPAAALATVLLLAGTYLADQPGEPGKVKRKAVSGPVEREGPGESVKAEGVKRPAQDKRLRASLRDVINRGADLFNSGDRAGCARLYEGALMAIRPVLKNHPDLQKEVEQGLAGATTNPDVTGRAFALRRVLDRIRDDLGGKKAKGAEKKGPGAGQKKGPGTGVKKGPATEKKAPPPIDFNEPTRPAPTPEPKKQRPPAVEKEPGPGAEATLWRRLGGQRGVRKVVDDFVKSAGKDARIDFTRGGKYKIDVPKLEDEMVRWVSQHTGGPLKYTDPNMKQVHKGMHITNREFDLTVDHIKKSLKDNGVKPADAAAVLRVVEGTRSKIVEKQGTRSVEVEQPPSAPFQPPLPPRTEPKKGPEPRGLNPAPKGPAPDRGAGASRVTGHVTYKGKPLPAGQLTFASADGGYSTYLNQDGTYELARVQPGTYVVAVTTKVVNPAPRGPAGAPPIATPALRGAAGAPYVAIPARFANPDTSGLRVVVQRGANTFDINLQ